MRLDQFSGLLVLSLQWSLLGFGCILIEFGRVLSEFGVGGFKVGLSEFGE